MVRTRSFSVSPRLRSRSAPADKNAHETSDPPSRPFPTDRRAVVLIVGGYGTFGARLVELLANEERLTIVVAGRSLSKASDYCTAVGPRSKADLRPAVFDRTGTPDAPAANLAAFKPDVVVDASGPFQSYGQDPYRLVKACVAAGVHYLDFADGAEFVRGIAEFDAAARAKGVAVISGVSTLPALSQAVVRHLARNGSGQPPLQVRDIVMGVAPSPRVTIGLNVMEAIASYAGKPVRGAAATTPALLDSRRFTIAPPGYLPLVSRRFSLVEVPDLTLARDAFPDLRSVWVGASSRPEIFHIGLSAMAWLVHKGLLPSLAPFARLFHAVNSRAQWGEHRGGMFVAVSGITTPPTTTDDARRDSVATETDVTRTWHLIAEGSKGPYIPCLPARVLLSRWLAGRDPAPGARTAAREVELEEFVALFAELGIHAGTRAVTTTALTPTPLYRRILGEAYARLPPAVQAMHDGSGTWTARGSAEVTRGTGLIARCAAVIFGFPNAGTDVPLTVRFDASEGGRVEKWTRNFGGKTFSSIQSPGKGRWEHLVCERFGPFNFAMALVVDKRKMQLVVRGWTFLGIPMPRFLAPRNGETYETVDEEDADGRFRFHVEIGFPWTGLIVRYRGWLNREY